METLWVAAAWDDQMGVEININVDLPTLLSRWGSLDRLLDYTYGLSVMEGGHAIRSETVRLCVHSARDFVHLLSLDGVVAAARRLNLDLIRKGPALNWKSHCLELADIILDPAGDDHAPVNAGDTNALFQAGFSADQAGNFERAEVFYRQAIDADPSNTRAALRLANLCAERGDLDQADTYYARAADAGALDDLFDLGGVFAERGDLDQAEMAFRHAAEAGHVIAMAGLGVVLQALGEADSADTYFRRAAESGDPTVLAMLDAAGVRLN